jgi:hypothetical protein
MVTKPTEVGSVKYVTILTRQVRARRVPNVRFVVFHAPKHFLLRRRRLEQPPRLHHRHTYPLLPQLLLLVRRRKLDVLRALS